MSYQFKLILSHIEGAINLGLIARSMNNFSLDSLTLINPQLSLEDSNISKFSPHSSHLLEKVSIVSSLEDIKNDCDLVIGFSRRTGQFRRKDLSLPTLNEFLINKYPSSSSIALVFGNEQVGLKDDEIKLCDFQCDIPTTGELGSLNLSHAVAIVLYELNRIPLSSSLTEVSNHQSLASLIGLLDRVNYFKKETKKELFIPYLSKLLSRGVNNHEDDLVLSNLFKRLEGIFQKKDHK